MVGLRWVRMVGLADRADYIAGRESCVVRYGTYILLSSRTLRVHPHLRIAKPIHATTIKLSLIRACSPLTKPGPLLHVTASRALRGQSRLGDMFSRCSWCRLDRVTRGPAKRDLDVHIGLAMFKLMMGLYNPCSLAFGSLPGAGRSGMEGRRGFRSSQ